MTDRSVELTVKLFGRPELVAGSVPKFPAKGYLLLGLLCCAPRFRMTRAEAANLLWDSRTDGDALTNLRQLLARVRRMEPFTGQLVVSDSSQIMLGDCAASIDLYRFTSTLGAETTSELSDKLMLYSGDLLTGIEEPTSGFSEWLLSERAALRNRFFSIADTTLVELTRYGRASAELLLRIRDLIVAMEPERENSYRSLIEAFGRNGMFDEARGVYADLVKMTRMTFDSEPTPETTAVARRVFSVAGEFSVSSNREAVGEDPAERVQPRVAILSVSDPAGIADRDLLGALLEDIANELSRYRTFSILAPHSAQAISHTSGIPNDNRVLRADYTISGFVKPGNSASLAIRMTNCKEERLVWAAEYPAETKDLVRTFRTLSSQIASSLAAELEREMFEALKSDRDGQAYWYYLQGQNQLKDCTLQGLRRARKAFRQSVKSDPNFALPSGRIAQTYYLEWLIRGGSDPELLLQARQFAQRAAVQDRGAAIGFWISGVVDLYQRKFDEAAERFAEAEALSPNSADLLVEYADALAHLGEADIGWLKFERAIELNPIPPDHYWWAGASIAFCQERYDKAVELCGRMNNAEPAVRLLAASHALLGQNAEARAYGRRIKEMYPSQPAGEISKVAPTRVDKVGERFVQGLRIAGV